MEFNGLGQVFSQGPQCVYGVFLVCQCELCNLLLCVSCVGDSPIKFLMVDLNSSLLSGSIDSVDFVACLDRTRWSYKRISFVSFLVYSDDLSCVFVGESYCLCLYTLHGTVISDLDNFLLRPVSGV